MEIQNITTMQFYTNTKQIAQDIGIPNINKMRDMPF